MADRPYHVDSWPLLQELRLAQAEVQRLRSELTAFATKAKDESEDGGKPHTAKSLVEADVTLSKPLEYPYHGC